MAVKFGTPSAFGVVYARWQGWVVGAELHADVYLLPTSRADVNVDGTFSVSTLAACPGVVAQTWEQVAERAPVGREPLELAATQRRAGRAEHTPRSPRQRLQRLPERDLGRQ